MVGQQRSPTLYISRHGESEMNLKKVIGGNGFLSENGRKYASALGEYIQSTVDVTNTKFITSTLNRTLQTARLANISVHDQDSNLDEINAGDYDQLTYDQIREFYPAEFKKRSIDKLGYRYPNGESYVDLKKRVALGLKKLDFNSKDHFLICHQAVARCILGILLNLPLEEVPHIEIPLHTVLRIQNGELTYSKII
jgi:broad specificity phosphatase PhoE